VESLIPHCLIKVLKQNKFAKMEARKNNLRERLLQHDARLGLLLRTIKLLGEAAGAMRSKGDSKMQNTNIAAGMQDFHSE
jgi:hypothetical protein